MSFMKTSQCLPRLLPRTRASVVLASLVILATAFGQAQHASCKAVADAQILLAKTPTMSFRPTFGITSRYDYSNIQPPPNVR